MNLDKFYTKRSIALECINLVPNISDYDLIIEPSAGNGSFSSQLDCVAYDLEPENDGIIQQDWLETSPFVANNILVIGNPPFGPRSSLAKQFIKHSQKIGAQTIAFILPDTFSKLSNQSLSLFPQEWKLIVEHKLSDCHFEIEGGKTYFVPCTFYVWTKKESAINLRQVRLANSEDFIFLPRESKEADFVINGNSGKVKRVSDVTNPKAEHYIKAGKKTAEDLIQIFESINYTFLSSINGGNAWIGQQDILKAYTKKLEEYKNL